MSETSNPEQSIELLQQLGLKEYEAKSFVALSRLPSGTAKELSELSEVPRTRIYDAIRVLETKGLVEVQHSKPQQFRAVPIDEAVETLKQEYETRTESLRESLRNVEPASTKNETEVTHEVWTLSGRTAIRNRTTKLIDEADDELVMVVGHEAAFNESLVDHLREARSRDVSLVVGTVDEALRRMLADAVPEAKVFVSGLEWLQRSAVSDDKTEITRLLLVDQSTILVSTLTAGPGAESDEKGVFGRGFDNGLVTIVRRLMATGLFPSDDPKVEGSVGEPSNE